MKCAAPSLGGRPVLSIAIPTYNRAVFLAELLSGLAPQVMGEGRVEVIVSDNASSDDTGAVVQKFIAGGFPLRFSRNEVNHGADYNILQCYSLAAGKYVLVCGDDDIILPGSVSKLLSYLTEDEYDLIYMSGYGFRGRHQGQVSARRRVFKKPETFTKAADLARHVHVMFTFISGNIVNKDVVEEFAHRPFEELVGTNLVQLGWIFTALNRHRKSLYIHERLLACRLENTSGYGLCKTFGPDLKAITGEWLDSVKTGELIENGTLQYFFPFQVPNAVSKNSVFIAENPCRILTGVFKSNFRYWLWVYPIIRLPGPLKTVWLFLVRAINRVDTVFGHPLFGQLRVWRKIPAPATP
jgi:glycosyltransferase involved in cell wall biosynthesis